ncbi:DUF5696 domain-containing protein [Paenibacillus chungangensis]|uniref:DUF5696 domain-containing protein n=1 Tax=Paenibacillus chungangensis TaxID=696535 RepID=A0ABW3HLL5_9BACL
MNRSLELIRNHIPQTVGVLLLLIVLIYVAATKEVHLRSDGSTLAEAPLASEKANPMAEHENMPAAASFEPIGETDVLLLSFDEVSGHFTVTDKRSGKVWHSYPNPEHWEQETIGGIWKNHLRAPVMIQTLDFETQSARPQISNWINANGTIEDMTPIDNGVSLTYVLTDIGVSIPVEIRIEDDYVETRIVDEGIIEGKFGILWVRLFPFFGAQHTTDQEGYFLIPDGSGAIVSFNDSSRNKTKVYKEPIYGQDFSYRGEGSSRLQMKMPVFGLKFGDAGFLSIVGTGAEYTDILASPSGVYSMYNWIGTEMRYRSPFEQITNRHRERSFITYDEEERFRNDRVVRYYLLDGEQSTYAGMANRYRQYLMDDEGYARIESDKETVPLHLTLLGGDSKKSVFMDSYVPMTTASQAMEVVQSLYGLGVEDMNINLMGWQEGGYSEFGDVLPIDGRLGGDDGIRSFVDFAHSLEFPVTYGVNYMLNNTGAQGFSTRYHAMRDLSGTIMKYEDWYGNELPMASLRYIDEYFDDDLETIDSMGFDGVTFGNGYWYGGGLGQWLISDYNDRYGSSRTQALEQQADYFRRASEKFKLVNGTVTGQYVNRNVSHVYNMFNDYSYDLFTDRSVPFMQMALHGLITYTTGYVNEREQYRQQLLRDLEYGALPSMILTHEPTQELNNSRNIRLFSSQYEEWSEKAVEQYQIYNEVQGGVMDQFIVDHRELADNVYETTYENGRKVVVNYNNTTYVNGSLQVEGKGYTVVKEGER